MNIYRHHITRSGMNPVPAAKSLRSILSNCLLALIVYATIPTAHATRAATLTNSRGTLTLDERGLSLTPLVPDCPTIVADGAPWWSLTLQTSAQPGSPKVALSSAGQKPRLEMNADRIRLVYDVLTNGTNTWKLGLTIELRRVADAFTISGELRNEAGVVVVRDFTCVALSGIKAVPATQPLLWANGLGERFAAEAKAGQHVFNYPSRQGTMQWCAFAGQRGGLYVGSHDSAHGAKTFTARFDPQAGQYRLAIRHEPFCGGGKWALPPTVLLPYAGTWHVAARQYRAWFDTVTPLRPVPDWVRNSSGWLLGILKQQNGLVMWDYPSLEQMARVADQRGLDILGLFGWAHGGHDHLYPDYIPDPQMGGPEALRNALKEVHRLGKRAIIYANGQLIDMGTDYYRDHGAEVAIVRENGTPFRQDWQKYRSFPAVKCVLACQSAKGWQERMRALAGQAQALGADGILFDQLAVTGPLECWATNHGHASPAMVYTADRVQWLRRVADEMKRTAPDFIVMTEGLHDAVLDSISLFHGCVVGEFDPTEKEMTARIEGKPVDGPFPEMFRYAFPEVLSTQRHPTPMLDRLSANYACLYGLRHEIESRYGPDVPYLKTDVIPTKQDYRDVLGPPNVPMMAATPPAEATAYLKRLIDFERRYAALLWRGRFVDDEGIVFRGRGLVAKAYAAGDRLGVLVWNATDQPATFFLEVPQFRLTGATEPERDRVEAFSPVPARSIRLLEWERTAGTATP